MRSFLLKGKIPVTKWSNIPDNTFFEGEIPKGFGLAISPNFPYVIIDIDNHGEVNGFNTIPSLIKEELKGHFQYDTPSGGKHIWVKYTGGELLINKASGLGIDLRTHKGYVRWYLPFDIRAYMVLIKPTSQILNNWLELLFTNKTLMESLNNENTL